MTLKNDGNVSTRHTAPVAVMLFGSCHLILFVNSTNYFQIVRWHCCLEINDSRISNKDLFTFEVSHRLLKLKGSASPDP